MYVHYYVVWGSPRKKMKKFGDKGEAFYGILIGANGTSMFCVCICILQVHNMYCDTVIQ